MTDDLIDNKEFGLKKIGNMYSFASLVLHLNKKDIFKHNVNDFFYINKSFLILSASC